jgi:hypothetical protein
VAKESYLVAAFVSVLPLTATVAIAMSVVTIPLLYVVIDIGSLHHLSEVQRHAVEDNPGLRIRVEVFVASSCNSSGSIQHLVDHENNYHKDKH